MSGSSDGRPEAPAGRSGMSGTTSAQPGRPRGEDLRVGDVIGERRERIGRDTLVRYAGASGDLNPIHYDDSVAQAVGLPGVIAHGMLTMGRAVNVISDWIGDPGAITEYAVRFTKPVPVPGGGAAELRVIGTIGAIDPEVGTVRVDLAVERRSEDGGGEKVLGRARATVRVPFAAGTAPEARA